METHRTTLVSDLYASIYEKDTRTPAQRQAAEKALEELEDMYGDALHGRKNYDPNLLRDYGHHVRWKVQKVLPDRFGEPKNRTGVEISDGSLKIVWETGSEDAG